MILAKPKRYLPQNEGDFVVLRDVPVFREHERDGVRFGKKELERIIQRCNERIEDTGDYAALCLRHTDMGDGDPEVVGFAGPYRLGRIGKLKPAWAILGDLRFFKDDYHKARKYPRLSVELWASKSDPTNGFFDPISLLGAETPHLDIGVRYQMYSSGGMVRKCYSMAMSPAPSAPSGSNTFVPGDDRRFKKLQNIRYGKESQMALSPEDIQQIIEALHSYVDAKVSDAVAGLNDPALDDSDIKTLDDEPVTYQEGDHNALPEQSSAEDEGGESVQRYKREASDYRVKYQKAAQENRDLRTRYQKVSKEAETAKREVLRLSRYQKLQQLETEGYVVDVQTELSDFESASNEQFDRHLEKIRTHYQRVPIEGGMFHQKPPMKTGEGEMEKRTRYSRQARERVERARAEGRKLTFEHAYAQVLEESGV